MLRCLQAQNELCEAVLPSRAWLVSLDQGSQVCVMLLCLCVVLWRCFHARVRARVAPVWSPKGSRPRAATWQLVGETGWPVLGVYTSMSAFWVASRQRHCVLCAARVCSIFSERITNSNTITIAY